MADRMDLSSEDVLVDLVDTLCPNVSSLEGMGIQFKIDPDKSVKPL